MSGLFLLSQARKSPKIWKAAKVLLPKRRQENLVLAPITKKLHNDKTQFVGAIAEKKVRTV